MVKEAEYTISDLYQGGYSTLDPNNHSYIGYKIPASQLGITSNPGVANQLKEVSQKLNTGAVPIEIGTLQQELFDAIPKQHFNELKRLKTLTGAKLSVHAPVIEPSGIKQEGQGSWSEVERTRIENQFNDVVQKAIDIDDSGKMPITIHSANMYGREYMIDPETGEKTKRLTRVIDKEKGTMTILKEEIKHYPGGISKGMAFEENGKLVEIPLEKGKKFTVEDELSALNNTEWTNSVSEAIFEKEKADEVLDQHNKRYLELVKKIKDQKIEDEKALSQEYQDLKMRYEATQEHLKETELKVKGLFDKAWKYGSHEDRAKLKQASQEYEQKLIELKKDPNQSSDLKNHSRALQFLIERLNEVQPEVYQDVTEFATEKSAETLSNVAAKAVREHGERAPVISIENVYPEMPFSMGDEMANLIELTRKKFIDKMKQAGHSESQAKKLAEEKIRMTFDMGHLNMARRYGFSEKDLLKEIEKVKKYVGHVHITDNFGFGDVHLSPGMGNVPIKEIMQQLEKSGFKGTKIIEAGGMINNFQVDPFAYNLEALGSPLYSTKMGPYWNQIAEFNQGYFSGMGEVLPQINYETMGSGFSQLPSELGGSRAGARGGRFSGRGME